MKTYAQMTIEELLAVAHVTAPTHHTYLYVNEAGALTHMEKPGHDTYPADEIESYGYVRKYIRTY